VPRGRKPPPFTHKQIKELREVGGDGYWRGGWKDELNSVYELNSIQLNCIQIECIYVFLFVYKFYQKKNLFSFFELKNLFILL